MKEYTIKVTIKCWADSKEEALQDAMVKAKCGLVEAEMFEITE